MKNLNIATAKTGDIVRLFSGWQRSIGQVVKIREGKYQRGVITCATRQIHGKDYLDYTLWEGAFPTFSQMVEGREHSDELLQEAWDRAHPGQAPRNCVECETSFRPTWKGPGSAAYCTKCRPPTAAPSSPGCHYCGREPVGIGFFGEPTCNECGS